MTKYIALIAVLLTLSGCLAPSPDYHYLMRQIEIERKASEARNALEVHRAYEKGREDAYKEIFKQLEELERRRQQEKDFTREWI